MALTKSKKNVKKESEKITDLFMLALIQYWYKCGSDFINNLGVSNQYQWNTWLV